MNQNCKGVIIEESLDDKKVFGIAHIVSTKIESVVEKHKTPWLKQWTLHTVEIDSRDAERVAEILAMDLEKEHPWYADFKNNTHHYIIFRGKFFYIDRTSKKQYDEAKNYGISLGIPDYQVDFHPDTKEWKR
ncbi:MAG: hypothetical protein AAB925_01495 [Patescibacteria group bacterium]